MSHGCLTRVFCHSRWGELSITPIWSTPERLAGPFSMWRTIHSLIEHGVILSKRDTRTRTRQPTPSTFSVDVPHVPHVPHCALNRGFHHTRTSKLQAEAERWRQKSAKCETARTCGDQGQSVRTFETAPIEIANRKNDSRDFFSFDNEGTWGGILKYLNIDFFYWPFVNVIR